MVVIDQPHEIIVAVVIFFILVGLYMRLAAFIGYGLGISKLVYFLTRKIKEFFSKIGNAS